MSVVLYQHDKTSILVNQCALQVELNLRLKKSEAESFFLCSVLSPSTQALCWHPTYFNPVNKRSKEEHKELHSGHGVLEEFPSVVLLLIIRGAGPGMSRRSLVLSLVDKGTTAPSPARTSVSSKSVIAAVLRGL